jgi:hypothetical protein
MFSLSLVKVENLQKQKISIDQKIEISNRFIFSINFENDIAFDTESDTVKIYQIFYCHS